MVKVRSANTNDQALSLLFAIISRKELFWLKVSLNIVHIPSVLERFPRTISSVFSNGFPLEFLFQLHFNLKHSRPDRHLEVKTDHDESSLTIWIYIHRYIDLSISANGMPRRMLDEIAFWSLDPSVESFQLHRFQNLTFQVGISYWLSWWRLDWLSIDHRKDPSGDSGDSSWECIERLVEKLHRKIHRERLHRDLESYHSKLSTWTFKRRRIWKSRRTSN